MSSFVRSSRPSDRRHVCDVTVTPCHLKSIAIKVPPTSSLTHIRNVDGLALNRGESDSNNQNEIKELLHCRIHQAGINKVLSEQRKSKCLGLTVFATT